jgi:hypothetical protein
MSRVTLLAPRHGTDVAVNGEGGCHARVANGGRCPGIELAEWLNGLGDDDAPYGKSGARTGTRNIDVRMNWLGHCGHLVAVEPQLAELAGVERRLVRELRAVRRRLKALRAVQRCIACGGLGHEGQTGRGAPCPACRGTGRA